MNEFTVINKVLDAFKITLFYAMQVFSAIFFNV